MLAERGFDPRTSGLWAQHASTAPLCSIYKQVIGGRVSQSRNVMQSRCKPTQRYCLIFLFVFSRFILFFFSFLNHIDYKSHSSGSLAERSKALVLGTSLSGGVGSNPTAVNFCLTKYYILFSFIHRHIEIVPTHSPDISGGTVARDELPCSESSRVSMITSTFCGKRSILDCILVPAIQFYLCPTLPSIFCSPTDACMWWPVSSVG